MLTTVFYFLLKYEIIRVILIFLLCVAVVFVMTLATHLIGAIFKLDTNVLLIRLYKIIFLCIVIFSIGYPSKLIINLYQKNKNIRTYYNENNSEHFEYNSETTNFKDSPGIHHVKPHYVNGYKRSDGTNVDGYWRGGDNGYYRSNPDGSLSNNLRNKR